MATPIAIPGVGGRCGAGGASSPPSGIPIPGGHGHGHGGSGYKPLAKKVLKGTEEDGYSSQCSSPASSPCSSDRSCNTPPLSTSYFGKQMLYNGETMSTPISSVVVNQSPPSPATAKRLLRIRKMSDMCRKPNVTGNISTIPIQPKDINESWAKLVINQHRIKHYQPPLPQTAVITRQIFYT